MLFFCNIGKLEDVKVRYEESDDVKVGDEGFDDVKVEDK